MTHTAAAAGALRRVLLVAMTLLAVVVASPLAATNEVYNYDVPARDVTATVDAALAGMTLASNPRGDASATRTSSRTSSGGVHLDPGVFLATKEADVGSAKFAQKSFSENFGKRGLFAGRTIDDVAGALRSGAMSPKDVPINVIVRDGNTLILNTRSAQALTRAGVSRKSWNVVNRTGDESYEGLLSGQLRRNGLDSRGTDLP